MRIERQGPHRAQKLPWGGSVERMYYTGLQTPRSPTLNFTVSPLEKE